MLCKENTGDIIGSDLEKLVVSQRALVKKLNEEKNLAEDNVKYFKKEFGKF
jgi:hypothetical protein